LVGEGRRENRIKRETVLVLASLLRLSFLAHFCLLFFCYFWIARLFHFSLVLT
jgi:hypothetical protein